MKNTNRLYEEKLNNQGSLMKIVEYNSSHNIIVEFQDEYRTKIKTTYYEFETGKITNPYFPYVLSVGIIGNKYKSVVDGKQTKEYVTWLNMMKRCFDASYKEKNPTYQNVACCKEWLLYENFYEWLHSQSNFDKWYHGNRWALDKDISSKSDKTYSPENCFLIPNNINQMFVKSNKKKSCLPTGVTKFKDKFDAYCKNPLIKNGYNKYLGRFSNPINAFFAYKTYKEGVIKEIAKIEFDKGNITEECYKAMMNYKVEITD